MQCLLKYWYILKLDLLKYICLIISAFFDTFKRYLINIFMPYKYGREQKLKFLNHGKIYKQILK